MCVSLASALATVLNPIKVLASTLWNAKGASAFKSKTESSPFKIKLKNNLLQFWE
jgi:hypothetical protein